MKLSSFIKDSFQEYEGKYSLILFSTGCNLDCLGCYNKSSHNQDTYDAMEILENYLNPMHEAVVFLGGEPTLWKDLPDIMKYVKSKNLQIKLFTNALFPYMIESVLPYVDSFSVDLKTLTGSENVLGVSLPNYLKTVMESLDMIIDSGKELEVRTTKWKNVNTKEIIDFMRMKYPSVRHIVQEDFYEGHY